MTGFHLWPGRLYRGLKYLRKNGWEEFTIKLAEYRLNQARPGEGNPPDFERNRSDPDRRALAGGRPSLNGHKVAFFLSRSQNRLSFVVHEEPVVSIVILVRNRSDLTYDCLETILAHTDVPYELIIIDNGSEDETGALLDRLEGVQRVRNKENRGFAAGANQGAERARGSYLLFLNNDTLVTPGWLSGLTAVLNSTPDCGAVGAKLVYPDGRLQEAGSILGRWGEAVGYGRGDHPLRPEYSYLREVDYCSAACLLVRRDLFQRLGGFDERFVPAYYEDCDLCLGLAHLGYRILFHPGVTVFHYEYSSSENRQKAHGHMARNRELLFQKWETALKGKKAPTRENLLSCRDLRPGPSILYLDDRIPFPCQGSGFPRAFQILTHLAELGCRVTVLPTLNQTPWQPVTGELQMKGVEVIYGEEPLDHDNFIRERLHHYPIVWISRIHNLARFLPLIQNACRKPTLIYDSEAIFARREMLKNEGIDPENGDRPAQTGLAQELGLMKNADLVVTVSEQEMRIIREAGVREVEILGYSLPTGNPATSFTERKDLLFLGSFLTPGSPNEEALLYFLREIFPAICRELHCKLLVVGYNTPEVIRALASDSVRVVGEVADLQPFFDRSRVFVVPHRYAAGIPLKLFSAMAQGLPAVCSRVIAEQVDGARFGQILVAENADEFIDQTIRLYREESLWMEIQKKSLEFIRRNSRPDLGRERLATIISRGLAVSPDPACRRAGSLNTPEGSA